MIKKPRGTYDLLAGDYAFQKAVLGGMETLASSYGFQGIETPMFEDTNLFSRSVGQETDIVNKEMYTFADRKGRSLTLRPELTAPVVRSYIEEKLYATGKTNKFYYYGPLFRYERPQKGRLRQFWQFGVESFANDNVEHDLEIFALAIAFLKHFDLWDKVTLKINNIGSSADRKAYSEVIKTQLMDKQADLCADCQRRLETNPLRVLDCKIDGHKEFIHNLPTLNEMTSEDSQKRFAKLLDLLTDLVDYEVDSHLVRGLDYYNDTVFEFIYHFDDADLAVISGGRYDTLVEQLGPKAVPAIGFAVGLERIQEAILLKHPTIVKEYEKRIDIYYAPLVDEAKQMLLNSSFRLRYEGLRCEFGYKSSLKAMLKEANEMQAAYVVILGQQELDDDVVLIKNMYSKEESKVRLSDFEADILQ